MYVQAEISVSGLWGLSSERSNFGIQRWSLSMLVLTTNSHVCKLAGSLSGQFCEVHLDLHSLGILACLDLCAVLLSLSVSFQIAPQCDRWLL
jgi:hypothetical protein